MRLLLAALTITSGCSTYTVRKAALGPHIAPPLRNGQGMADARGEAQVGASTLMSAGAPEEGEPLEWRPQTVGGKPVQVAEPTDEFPTPVALYATGDTLYFVTSTSAEAFEQILEQLP